MSLAIAGKIVLVTGANRGLGRAVVDEALRRGAKRVYAASRRPWVVADERVTPLILDVTERPDVEELVRVHRYLPPGDVRVQWGTLATRKESVSLILRFTRPSEVVRRIRKPRRPAGRPRPLPAHRRPDHRDREAGDPHDAPHHDGPKERLLTSETLSRTFDLPIQVGRHDGYFHAW